MPWPGRCGQGSPAAPPPAPVSRSAGWFAWLWRWREGWHGQAAIGDSASRASLASVRLVIPITSPFASDGRARMPPGWKRLALQRRHGFHGHGRCDRTSWSGRLPGGAVGRARDSRVHILYGVSSRCSSTPLFPLSSSRQASQTTEPRQEDLPWHPLIQNSGYEKDFRKQPPDQTTDWGQDEQLLAHAGPLP